MIRFKKAMCGDGNEVVLRLYVPKGARSFDLWNNAKKTSVAKVLGIFDVYGHLTELTEAYSEHDPSFLYRVGEWVIGTKCAKQTGGGIYSWKTFNEALWYWAGSRNADWRKRTTWR